jgi:hypothetical protein
MNESFRILLNQIKDGLHDIGMSNDIGDRGSAAEAEEVYQRGRNSIRRAIEDAPAEDREIFQHLFGPKTDFNKISWAVSYEYILDLLKTDPDISLDQLRDRIPHFLQTIEKLKTSSAATQETVSFRFTKTVEPSLLKGFLLLIAQKSGPPGWYYEHDAGEVTSFHFSIEGAGVRIGCRSKIFEYDLLLQDVWVHCQHPMSSREQEIKLFYEDDNAGKEMKEALIQIFKSQSWELFEQ